MKNLEELKALRDRLRGDAVPGEGDGGRTKVVVGMATCGIAAGAKPVMAGFIEEVEKRGLRNVQVGQTGCIGICQYEPVVEVFAPNKEKVTYVKMSPGKVAKIVKDHIMGGKIVREYTIGSEAV
jgi:NADP-reducing hydrogenase subunit HndB